MARVVAGFDYERTAHVATKWPLRELLVSYVHRLKANAAEQHRHDDLVWAAIAPHAGKKMKRPPVPRILRDDGGNS